MLKGKKTYGVSIGLILAAATAFLTGEASLAEAIQMGLTGLGLATLRMGVKEDKKAAQAVIEQSAARLDTGGGGS